MATKETPAARIARLEAELNSLRAQVKAAKVEEHAAEKAATAALVKWFDTTPAGKKFAAAHYQTQAKARYALSKDGYVGSWAFDLAKAAGYKA